METTTKTLIIKGKGRKYFDCVIGGYKAKLLINEISETLQIDRVVRVLVNDLCERSKYGAVLRFEPLQILDDRDAEALRVAAAERKTAEKWLRYAESDVVNGVSRTNAIHEALSLCPKHEHLAERVAALKDRVNENSAAHEAQKRASAAGRGLRRQMRILFPGSRIPDIGTPVRHGGRVVVFESIGDSWFISADDPSTEGAHLLGYEGEVGRYCHYREATPGEIAFLETSESKDLT